MIPAISTTMDAAGRLVVPKPIRDAAGVLPGMPLEVRCEDGRIVIEPLPREVRVVDRHGFRVAEPVDPGEALTPETVRRTRDKIRRRREPR